jgi:DNA-binding transcriptional MocR family regulator
MLGFLVWVEMPEYVDSLRLYEQAMEKGITLAPGPISSAKRKYRNYMRLNAARWDGRIEWAVAELGQLACKMKD